MLHPEWASTSGLPSPPVAPAAAPASQAAGSSGKSGAKAAKAESPPRPEEKPFEGYTIAVVGGLGRLWYRRGAAEGSRGHRCVLEGPVIRLFFSGLGA